MTNTPRKPGPPIGSKNALKGDENLKTRGVRLTDSQWEALKLAAIELGTNPNSLIQKFANNIDTLKKAL